MPNSPEYERSVADTRSSIRNHPEHGHSANTSPNAQFASNDIQNVVRNEIESPSERNNSATVMAAIQRPPVPVKSTGFTPPNAPFQGLYSVHPLTQSNHNVLPLIFRKFTESDYDYSDSEEDAAMEIQRNEPMGQNVDNTELRLLIAKYEKFGMDIERGHSLRLFEDPYGDDWRNRLCPYCLSVVWTKEHRAECLFIPKCIM